MGRTGTLRVGAARGVQAAAVTRGPALPCLTAALTLALTGPGDYSLDAVLGLKQWWTPPITALVLAAGVVGGFGSLVMRRQAPTVAHAWASGTCSRGQFVKRLEGRVT
jgi:hypothetical protein